MRRRWGRLNAAEIPGPRSVLGVIVRGELLREIRNADIAKDRGERLDVWYGREQKKLPVSPTRIARLCSTGIAAIDQPTAGALSPACGMRRTRGRPAVRPR